MITAIQDCYPHLRLFMTPAWAADRPWQIAEPGGCRPVPVCAGDQSDDKPVLVLGLAMILGGNTSGFSGHAASIRISGASSSGPVAAAGFFAQSERLLHPRTEPEDGEATVLQDRRCGLSIVFSDFCSLPSLCLQEGPARFDIAGMR